MLNVERSKCISIDATPQAAGNWSATSGTVPLLRPGLLSIQPDVVNEHRA